MKYKAGDRVEIRRDKPYPPYITETLAKHGYVVTITGTGQLFGTDDYYYLKEFVESFAWKDTDIEGIAKKTGKMKHKIGDEVVIKRNIKASKELKRELEHVNYIVYIADVVDMYKNDKENFYYVSDQTGKHDWFSVYEDQIIVEQVNRFQLIDLEE